MPTKPDRILDARPDRIDLRDRLYQPPLASLPPRYPEDYKVEAFFPDYSAPTPGQPDGMVLDQGSQGACTGFGLAATINYLLWRQQMEDRLAEKRLTEGPTASLSKAEMLDRPARVSERMLYHLARLYDEWPGEDYEGSSCRGAVKAWHKHGVCTGEIWPYLDADGKENFVHPKDHWREDAAGRPLGAYYRIDGPSISDVQAAIHEVGAVYASATVHRGWEQPRFPGRSRKVEHANLPIIDWAPGAETTGGHAFALVGYNENGFIVQNSWAKRWGLKGFAILTYDDWRENASDAWACVMGAPTKSRVDAHFSSSSLRREAEVDARMPAQFSLGGGDGNDHAYANPEVQPWSSGRAFRHTVVMGNEGRVIPRLVDVENAAGSVDRVVCQGARQYFEAGHKNPPKIAIYAHGGLNSEGDSIDRIKTLGPYFAANGIYPVFMTWKTGTLETLLATMQDAANRWFPRSEGWGEFWDKAKDSAADALDRTLEVASANLGVKAIWSQMKQNAAAASMKDPGDRGGYLTVAALAKLKREYPRLQIYWIGHSAGSILLGHMLDDMARHRLKIAGCHLYAAACSVDFANRHYAGKSAKTVLSKANLYLHMLDDTRERGDTVGPYRKSLLYLVSRALEDWHKTPLLGMRMSFDASTIKKDDPNDTWHPATRQHVKDWQDYWGDSEHADELSDNHVITAANWEGGQIQQVLARIKAAHGSFDNDVEIIDETLRRIVKRDALENAVENLRY